MAGVQKPQWFRQVWRGWYRRALDLAERGAPLKIASVFTWSEVPRKGAVAPRWVRYRSGAEWASFQRDFDLVLQVDWGLLFRQAVLDEPAPALERLYLEALALSQWFFAARDPILGHLLGRLSGHLAAVPRARPTQLSADSSGIDPRETALLRDRLLALLDREPILPVRWAAHMRTGFQGIAPRALQRTPPGATMVLDPDRIQKDACFASSRPPAMEPPDLPADIAAAEARWLLACDAWRDGARRIGDTVVVNLASYALVAQMLERETFLVRECPYPAPGARKADWYVVGDQWGACLRTTLDGAWVSHRDPRALAASVGWDVAPDAPMVSLNAAALATTAKQKAPAARLRYTGQRLGGPRILELTYEETPVTVTRVSVPRKGSRFYFEAPYDVPLDFLERHGHDTARHRAQVGGRVQWSVDALEWQAAVVLDDGLPEYPRAKGYAAWARQQYLALEGGEFERLADEAARKARLAAWEAGEAGALGPFVPGEDAVIAAYLETRPRGPVRTEELEILASQLPGRTPLGIRRRLRPLMVRRAREIGWPAFRQTGWWPGNDEARVVYQLAKRR